MPDRRYPHGVFLLWAEQQGNGSLPQIKQHVCLFRAHAVRLSKIASAEKHMRHSARNEHGYKRKTGKDRER